MLAVSAATVLACGPARAQLAEPDRTIALTAIAEANRDQWAQAYAEAERSRDPLPLKLVRWLDYTHVMAGDRFNDIAEFIEHNPGWPYQKTLQRRAEEALAFVPDQTAAAWLARHPPISAAGKTREAELKLARGDAAGGTAELRQVWIDGDFSPLDERNFWARYGGLMRPEDHVRRTERLLWDGQHDAAQRMLPMLPADYRALAEACLALGAGAANAQTLVARVPAPLQSDPQLAFQEVRWRRKNDMNEAAAQILLAHPDNPVRPAAWWSERQLVARRLLAAGDPQLAYRLVTQHGLAEGHAFSDAEFLAGYIALRYLRQPKLAYDHFALILARVHAPDAKARAAYWSGRAADAEGRHDLALKWYSAGAENLSTFYGQLSAHQLGRDAPPRPQPEPRPSAAEWARFNSLELVRATLLFIAAGDRERTRIFFTRLADDATRIVDFAMLAAFAERHGRVDLAILAARRAMEAGTPLMIHGYPIVALPPGGTIEPALIYAIVRQESAFDQYAISRAGARGLMQLMPGTAATVARRLQMRFAADRLTADGVYNLELGSAYLATLIDDFNGSYALAIASYNAGPGRVRQWLRDYGDPRGHDGAMVDWIESIPIAETRLYVQRVLESLQVYRGQNHSQTAFSLAGDLAR